MTIDGKDGSGLLFGTFSALGTVIGLSTKASSHIRLILIDQNCSPPPPKKKNGKNQLKNTVPFFNTQKCDKRGIHVEQLY